MVKVIACDPLLPTRTFPKLKLAGFAASCACTPVPLKAIAAGDPGALLLMAMLPLKFVAEAGANCTLNDTLDPALTVCGTLRPVTLNPVPVTVA